MNLQLKRTPGIYIVGFMGSGKSVVGRLLAHRLGWSFFDLDHEIEAAEKTAISAIFDTRGEAEFRRIETGVLRRHVAAVEQGRPAVVALGGGAFAQEENRNLLAGRGITIWLDCPFDVVSRRVAQASHRPLARDPQRFAALYQERLKSYRVADIHIPIASDDPADAVAKILAAIRGLDQKAALLQ
ncbi:MAG TPA: shikimate kinase [Bryobacteraceae bacterium]|nr:shikimate kinase [Bryobacteraceae bacterium]